MTAKQTPTLSPCLARKMHADAPPYLRLIVRKADLLGILAESEQNGAVRVSVGTDREDQEVVPARDPRPKKITALLRKMRDTLRASRPLPVQAAVGRVNPIVRGLVNFFRIGNSSRAFNNVKCPLERKVRRFAVKKSKRTGFGWKRWSSEVVYRTWGLFGDYRLAYPSAKARTRRTESQPRWRTPSR